MQTIYLILKTLLAGLTVLGIGSAGLAPMTGGGDFDASDPARPGDQAMYLQIAAEDTGFDTFRPGQIHGGYHYGPSIILNRDGSMDLWSAANGPGDIVDVVTYSRLFDGGRTRTKEVVALSATPESQDERWTCDPGVIKFGGYYYIGYTSTMDDRGVCNHVYVARSRNPDGPFDEKWTGDGWGVSPVPLVEYTDNPEAFGAGEPSFVLLGDTLYIYYSWCTEKGATTRVATADAADENWPATLRYHGECIPLKNDGDSADVKYADAYGRFVAVFTEKRFSDDSYVAVWESFDGITFRRSGFVKNNTAKKLHNCGISGRADGHIGADDPVYLSYAYGNDWGNWPTRLHGVTLSLSTCPRLPDSSEENVDIPVERRGVRLIPEVTMIKGEKQVYHIQKSQHIWVMAMDSDGFTFPILLGATFDGYDKSVIRVVGNRIFAVGSGTTRVNVHWNGLSGQFVVHTDAKPN